jgi:hypothetical protein
MELIVSFTLRQLYLGERDHGKRWLRDRVGLISGLEAVDKEKMSFFYWESKADSSAVQRVVHRYTD